MFRSDYQSLGAGRNYSDGSQGYYNPRGRNEGRNVSMSDHQQFTPYWDPRDRLMAQASISFQNLHQAYALGRQPDQYENHQRSVNFQFEPCHNNYVLEWPVPHGILSKVPRELQQEQEFKYVRYSAAVCDPKNYKKYGYDLRQRRVTQGSRQVELFIAITMYDEDDELLARTLIGVFENIRYIENQSGWSRSSWKNIVVCVIADGVEKLNPRAAALLAALGVYQPTARERSVPQMGNRTEWKDTVAHIYEYTTHMELDIISDVVQVKEGKGPIQMIFCLKQENQQKINSHRWFFQAFGDFLRPNICVLLDAGTKPGPASIYHLWNAFVNDDNCAGACGEIKAMLGPLGRKLWNPLVATQNFEYKMSNILDKPLESAFGFISVLPGAFSAYRYAALQDTPGEKFIAQKEDSPLEKYYKGEYMHVDSIDKPADPSNKFLGPIKNFFQENMYLAEDRILCYELVAKRDRKWVLRYVQQATGTTDVPEAVDKFISQRRRWLNGSFFAAVYSICHTLNIWQSGHSLIRKLMLTILVIYQIISMIFAWYALANFFLVFRIITRSLGDSNLLGNAGLVIAVVFEWSYLMSLIACFILALGNQPRRTKKIYLAMACYWAVLMCYFLFASMFLTVKSVQAELLKGKVHLSDVFTDSIFSTLILSMLSTYVMWFIASVLFNEPWHMITSSIQYLLLTPTYINILNVYAFCNTNDLSWGTRPTTKPRDNDATSTKVAGQERFEIWRSGDVDLNADHEKQLALLQYKPPKETRAEKKLKKQNLTKEEKEAAKKAYYAQVRSGIVLSWVFSNLVVCTLVLESVSVSVIINPKKSQEAAQAGNTKIYLQVVLWSVAGLSFFKFLGAMWFRITTWRRSGPKQACQGVSWEPSRA